MRPRLLLTRALAVLVVVGCADAAAPNLFGPMGEPEFAIVPSVAPNGQFSSAGATFIQKGFNPVNPRNGDAVIVTFFWSGSVTITSVFDHETNGKLVGNTYNLVETVSSGGINMATYVAVNVQGFPSGFDERTQAGDSILVVQANMSGPVTAGGMFITAWSGVQPTIGQALGGHSQGSGSSTTQTMADPGQIAVNPGALVYAVTMGNQVVGMDPPPPPFVNVNNASDPSNTIKGDAERMVQGSSAGTSHPTWVWGFNSGTPRTWLATVLALNEVPTAANQSPTAAFTSSCTALTCSFTNTSTDADGSISSSNWNFGDGQTSTAASPSHSYSTAGTYTVTLTVTDNGGATNTVSHPVTVAGANQSPTAAFTSSCANLTCTFANGSSDPDGSIASNSWNFGDGATSTAASPSHSYTAAGTYNVTLTVTDNQGATNAVAHSVTVSAANQSPTAAFTSSCTNLTCTFTNGSSDPDGSIASYTWNFGDGTTSTAQNPSHSYTAAGSYTVTLRVTDNQGAQSPVTSKTVTVTAPNQAPTANFTYSCNGLTCGFTSTSSDPDGSIASYSWNFGDGTTSTVQNPSHTYGAGGSYTVTLRVTDNQGAQSPTTSKTVTVTAPNQAPVVNAGADETVLLGLLYSATFSFSDPDNGPWTYTVNWGDGSTSTGSRSTAGSFSLSHTYLGISILGTRTITVTITDSRGASGSDTKNVTIVLF